MNKYIYCFIFGLILFLILNSKNGFSIGVPTIEIIDKLSGKILHTFESEFNAENIHTIAEAKQWFITNEIDYLPGTHFINEVVPLPIDDVVPGIAAAPGIDAAASIPLPYINVNIFGISNDKEECVKQDKCEIPKKLFTDDIDQFGQTDFLYSYCPDGDTDCDNYHTIPYECHNECPVEISNFSSLDEDSSKNMDVSGFEFIKGVFDTEDLFYNQYLALISKEEKRQNNELYGYIDDYDLFFQEYILIKYLEKIYPNKHVHKINFGIFYIDGFLYFYKLSTPIFRSDISKHLLKEKQDAARPHVLLFSNTLRHGALMTFPRLHFDYANYPLQYNDLYPGTNDEVFDTLSSSDKYEKLLSKLGSTAIDIYFNLKNINFLRYINDKGIGISEEYIHKLREYMDSFKKSLEYFNIWIKLDGTENSKSLAFADINESDLPGMLVDDGNLNISRINKNRPAPHVNYTGTLYTPESMNPGDILRFDTKHTPHVALKQNPNEWRLSGETRYCTLKKDFNIENFYTVDDSNKLVQKDDVTEDYLIIDESLFNYFSAKYEESSAITIEEFKTFLNNDSIFPSVTECIDGETWSPNGVDVPAPCKACRICDDDQYVIHTCIKTRNKQCGRLGG